MQEFCNSNPPMITGTCNHKNTQARHHRNLKLESKLKYFNNLILSYVIQVRQKILLFPDMRLTRKNFTRAATYWFIFLFIYYSTLVSFTFSCFDFFILFLFCFFVFWNWKYERVSDNFFFHPVDFQKQDYFFWPGLAEPKCHNAKH